MKPLLLVLLFTACGCPQKTGTDNPAPATQPPTQTPAPTPTPPETQTPAPTPTPTPAPTPAPTPTPPPTKGSGSGSAAEPAPNWPKGTPGIGDNCGPNDACGKGLTCVSYYGIAGARGPQFKTCEIKCKSDASCPADHKCVTIADGPGQVCRK
ncbi:MAG TPA: hypothetical protein VIV40_14005 [Kofleriaceae bacterium]